MNIQVLCVEEISDMLCDPVLSLSFRNDMTLAKLAKLSFQLSVHKIHMSDYQAIYPIFRHTHITNIPTINSVRIEHLLNLRTEHASALKNIASYSYP